MTRKKIIDQLSWKKGHPKRKTINTVVKLIGLSLTIGLFSVAALRVDSIYQKRKPHLIAKHLVKMRGSEEAVFDYFKQNPNLVDKFPNDYYMLKKLRTIVLERDKIPHENLSALEKLVVKHKQKEEVSDAEKFTISDEDNSRIQKVRELNPETQYLSLRKIWNTPFGILFGYQYPVVVGPKDNHPELWEKIQDSAKQLGSFEMGDLISSCTRAVYKNNKLYINNSSRLWISDGKSVSVIYKGFWSGRFEDYLVLDNKNGEDRIAILKEAGTSGQDIQVYNANGSKLYDIKLKDLQPYAQFNFQYGKQNPDPIDLFTPKDLKAKIKERLKQ